MSETNTITLDILLDILQKSEADAWEITDYYEKGWEFYFIRHYLDQHRIKDIHSYTIKVYRKVAGFLGSAEASIPSDISEHEARCTITNLCNDAFYVQNPFYTLNSPSKKAKTTAKTNPISLKAISSDFIRILSSISETATEYLNSYEIFVSQITRHFLNSEGIDIIDTYPSSMIETIINARNENKEIELYSLFKAGTCDSDQLTKIIKDMLIYGKDKLIAIPTPNISKTDVVFSTESATELYRFFVSNLYASEVYMGTSNWKIGDLVASEDLTLRSVQFLPNSSYNVAFDEEGAPIQDLVLIDHGKVTNFIGNRQFTQYLGMETSFIISNIAVSSGTESESDLRTGDFLEVIEFSNFIVDPVSGNIAGEIRLAYLHNGNITTPVSGGSISGNFREFAQTMRFSKNLQQYNTMLIPAITRLNNVTITGFD